MATTTSTMASVITAAQQALRGRGGLAGVTVASGPRALKDLGMEWIVLAVTVELTQRFAAASSRYKEERYTLRNTLHTEAPGADETLMAAVRDRGVALLAEVEDEVRTNMTLGVAGVLTVQLSAAELRQGYTDTGWVVEIDFGLDVHARLISS